MNEIRDVPPADTVDVAILGGGVAGLTLALQLRKTRPDIRVVVIEKRRHPVPETIHKVGESTVEIAAYYLREILDLKEHLSKEQLNKFGLRVFFSNNGNMDIARRIELGHSVCPPGGVGTYQLDRGRLENALGKELLKNGIQFIAGCKIQDVLLQPDGEHHHLSFHTGGGETHRIAARWIVDATGRTSLLKRQLGLSKKVAHQANAAWFRVDHPIDVDEWSDDPEWHSRIQEGRRELSTNHLMGPGYWVWLIRLASGSTSVGIVTDATVHSFERINRFERALEWLHEHEPQCAEVIDEHRDKLQDFRVMRDYAYSSKQVFSKDRWCLAGEAGVFLDPLYSPGLDLIAISNGLITDLIAHALNGDDVEERSAIHNEMFLIIADGWLVIYENQYPLMGNPRIMLAKVIWDTAVYWAVPGVLYFHDKIRELVDLPGVVAGLARFSVASKEVQRFFREWGAIDESGDSETFVRFYDFDFMQRLHVGMTAGLGDLEFKEQFAANVRFIEQLSGQLVATVIEEFEADSENGAKRRQVELWKGDRVLMTLVNIYEEDRYANPVSDRWITHKRAEHGAAMGDC